MSGKTNDFVGFFFRILKQYYRNIYNLLFACQTTEPVETKKNLFRSGQIFNRTLYRFFFFFF